MKLTSTLSALSLLCLSALPFSAQGTSTGFDPNDWFDVVAHNVTPGDMARMTLLGIDVQSVHGPDALVYVDQAQMDQLKAIGLKLTRRPKIVPSFGARAYHSHTTLTTQMQGIAAAYPSICQLTNVGDSVQGRELWVMKISDNVNVEEDEPEFRYVSTMHGDEIVGQELCLMLINQLTSDYGTDPRITDLVDDLEIWIMPNMNPDGTAAGSRYNAQGYDLNRNFPDRINDPVNTTAGRPHEIQLVMNWAFTHSPILSANFHGGSLCVNYPFDSDPNPWTSYSATPDDDVFIDHSLVYTSTNLPMYNSWSFQPYGITNGAAWYVIYGGLQDWSYEWMGCNDVTIELDNSKWPPYSAIAGLWSDNQESMLAYMELALTGVRGLVTDFVTGAPLNADVRVFGRQHDVFTDPDVGDYHRLLLPGTYDFRFQAPGYVTKYVNGVVVGSGDATRVDVELLPDNFNPAAPDIKVEGLDGPVSFPYGQPVSINVELDPGDMVGMQHDWWIRATNGTVTVWWSWPGNWPAVQAPSYQGPLAHLPSLQVAYGVIPPGTWTLTFAVDPLDGVLTEDYSDEVVLTIY